MALKNAAFFAWIGMTLLTVLLAAGFIRDFSAFLSGAVAAMALLKSGIHLLASLGAVSVYNIITLGGLVPPRLETDYALLPRARHPAVSAHRARVDVDLLDLPAARIPRWSGTAGPRLNFPAAHHDRIRMGTKQRHADGGNQ